MEENNSMQIDPIDTSSDAKSQEDSATSPSIDKKRKNTALIREIVVARVKITQLKAKFRH